MRSDGLTAGYVALHEIEFLPDNPKDHDLGAIWGSQSEFGFLQRIVINRETGHLIGGAGRVKTLLARYDAGEAPPANVRVETGDWLVPCDFVALPREREMAAALALNQVGLNGLNVIGTGIYDDAALVRVLTELGEGGVVGTGFDADSLYGDVITRYLREQGEASPRDDVYAVVIPCANQKSQQVILHKLSTLNIVGRVVSGYAAQVALGK